MDQLKNDSASIGIVKINITWTNQHCKVNALYITKCCWNWKVLREPWSQILSVIRRTKPSVPCELWSAFTSLPTCCSRSVGSDCWRLDSQNFAKSKYQPVLPFCLMFHHIIQKYASHLVASLWSVFKNCLSTGATLIKRDFSRKNLVISQLMAIVQIWNKV